MAVRFNDSHYRSYIAKSHVEFVEQQSYTMGIQTQKSTADNSHHYGFDQFELRLRNSRICFDNYVHPRRSA